MVTALTEYRKTYATPKRSTIIGSGCSREDSGGTGFALCSKFFGLHQGSIGRESVVLIRFFSGEIEKKKYDFGTVKSLALQF